MPVFQLLAEKYLDPNTLRKRSARDSAFQPHTIRRLAAEIARRAFEQAIEIDQPWTDWAGSRTRRCVGRPVSFHAMRGISAHSNGFQTCRALHLLQMLIGSDRCAPAASATSRHTRSRSRRIRSRMASPVASRRTSRCPARPSGYPRGPEDLLIDADGKPKRIDKAFSVGRADRRPRSDAHGDPKSGRATRTRSTRCSCTWPTWPGTRR